MNDMSTPNPYPSLTSPIKVIGVGGGVAANVRQRTRALASSEGGAELDFHRNRARVKGLGIGVAHDEIHALDAAVVHGVHRI